MDAVFVALLLSLTMLSSSPGGRYTSRTHRPHARGAVKGGRGALPKVKPLPTRFQELGISSVIYNQLEKVHEIVKPTPIQAAAIPEITKKAWNPSNDTIHDIMIEGQTGSGKTLAYALPILTNIDNYNPKLQAIICAHTRELVVQINSTMQTVAAGGKKKRKANPIRIMALEGNGGWSRENKAELTAFQRNTPHVLIATPAMAEWVISNSREVGLEGLNHVVLDEVDQLLSMQNHRQGAVYLMSRALDYDAQLVFVSATITQDVERVGEQFMTNQKRITPPMTTRYGEKRQAQRLPDRLKHTVFTVKDPREDFKLLKLVQMQKALTRIRRPEGELLRQDVTTILVFINDPTQISPMVQRLRREFKLNVRGLGARSTREHYDVILKELREGQLDMLIATDFLARGMDMFGVTDVVNYDLPRSGNMYLHRAGRAGRMKGKFSHQSHVVSFCDAESEDKQYMSDIIRGFGEKPQRVWISEKKLTYGT